MDFIVEFSHDVSYKIKTVPRRKTSEGKLYESALFEQMHILWHESSPNPLRLHLGSRPLLAHSGILHDLNLLAEDFFDPLAEITFLVLAIGSDQIGTRKAAFEWFEQQSSTTMILNIYLMH